MDVVVGQAVDDAAKVVAQVFPGLGPPEIAALIEEATIRAHPADTTLCHEDRHEDTFYILLDGEVSITANMPDGAIRQLARASKGSFFGEMALIDNSPRTATATTVCESTLAEISRATFMTLLSQHPSVAITILKKVTANLRATDRTTIADLSHKNRALYLALQDLKAAQAELVVRERMARDLEIAGDVQRSLLPQAFPDVRGWSMYGCNIPALEVGGDYFDVIALDTGKFALILADVADKSVQAALYMAMLRSLFVAEAKSFRSPRETLLSVHRGYFEAVRQTDTFATVFYGVLNVVDASFRYVRGGHDYPLMFRNHGKQIEELNPAGRFIGMIEDLKLEERETTFNPGDTLMIYSDGVPDAVDSEFRSYGMDRFRRIARKHTGTDARELCDRVLEDIHRHRSEAPVQDDITLLAAKRLG